jgi:ABC-type multidrug transport system fused ATPase/permease subunit
MPSSPSVTNDPNKNPVAPAGGSLPVPAASDLSPKDNLAQKDALVVVPDTLAFPDFASEEQPEIDTPEQFRSKKPVIPKDLPDYFLLLATQQKKDLEQKKVNMESRLKSSTSIQKAQEKANLETDKKINEQTESQQKSNAKSGFLSIFTKIFSVITFAIGAAMMFVPGLQPLGIALMVTSAIAFATSFPEVMKALGDVFTKILTPLLGEELAKKIGPIVAAVVIAVTQIAIMVAVPNPAQALSAAAAILKTISAGSQIAQAAVSGGVGISIGVNNLDLADITNALDKLLASSDLFSAQFNNLLDALNKEYQNMSDSVRKYVQQIDDTPKISIA